MSEIEAVHRYQLSVIPVIKEQVRPQSTGKK
jgi:hypothetical protein